MRDVHMMPRGVDLIAGKIPRTSGPRWMRLRRALKRRESRPIEIEAVKLPRLSIAYVAAWRITMLMIDTKAGSVPLAQWKDPNVIGLRRMK